MPTLKILSWNVNGIRATMKKGFMDWFNEQDADIVGIQETKAQVAQIPEELTTLPNYHSYFTQAEKKGYSGVGFFTKIEPNKVSYGFGMDPAFDSEGRIVCAEYDKFVVYAIYFPNGGQGDHRIKYKLEFYDAFLEHAENYRKQGFEIVVFGDVNTAHKPIDLARPKQNENNTGFLPEERAWIDKLIDHGYHDTLRMFTDEPEIYTYWDQRFRARDRNVGWRIDYVFVSDGLKSKVKNAFVQMDQLGSDHCPLGIQLEV